MLIAYNATFIGLHLGLLLSPLTSFSLAQSVCSNRTAFVMHHCCHTATLALVVPRLVSSDMTYL